jgi:hypothetical protein
VHFGANFNDINGVIVALGPGVRVHVVRVFPGLQKLDIDISNFFIGKQFKFNFVCFEFVWVSFFESQ